MTRAPFNRSYIASALVFATVLWAASPASAQSTAAPAAQQTAQPSASSLPQVDAEVRKVDARAGKITLKHGDIPNLEMPPMTMVFQVRAESLPPELKVGDKVRVRIDKVAGAYTVMALEVAP